MKLKKNPTENNMGTFDIVVLISVAIFTAVIIYKLIEKNIY